MSPRLIGPSTQALLLSFALALALVPVTSQAAGMYPTDRGVRPMGRGGAFIAGADDLGAIWYNPAGVSEAGSGALVDFGWLNATARHTPNLQVRDADGTLRNFEYGTIQGKTSFLPFPTLALSKTLDAKREWTVAGAVYTPYGSFLDYPDAVDGVPSPSRYMHGSLDGSVAAMSGLWLGWRPQALPWLRAGVGAQLLTGKVQTDAMVSASLPDRVLAAPEHPDFDAQARITVGPMFAPSANAGVILIPHARLRIGLSGQLPMVIDSPARIQVRLPQSPLFDDARLEGSRLRLRMTLPGVARAGGELRPVDEARVEFAYVREFWSAHREVEVRSEDLRLSGVVGLPSSIVVPTIVKPRNFQDSSAFRLGGEWQLALGGRRLDLRGGVAYETSAVPPAYVSVQSVDMDKVTASMGVGLHLSPRWRLDAVYAHVFSAALEVAPEEAKVPRTNPISGNVIGDAINGGRYELSAGLLGVGVQYLF